MPIASVRARTRQVVAFYRESPPADALKELESRDYRVEVCDEKQLLAPEYLAGVSAIVMCQSERKPLQIERDFRTNMKHLLNHDCQIVLFASRDGSAIITNAVVSMGSIARMPGGQIPPSPGVHVYNFGTPWRDIANFLQTSPVSDSLNLSLAIEGSRHKDEVVEVSDVLLRRAFRDCASVFLEPLNGARSGAFVYRAYAKVRGSLGSTTQPFFIKICTRDKAISEYATYDDKVDPYIPFHLAPHLDRGRCCLGATDGVLVVNFVGESEDLISCAGGDRASTAIAGLLERTLRGWQLQAVEVDKDFASPLLGRFPARIDEARLDYARQLGATLNLGELKTLFQRCTVRPVLVGPVHGDLHATNVRVRLTDAILIDFETYDEHMPLLCDLASLEASLLVDGDCGGELDANEWMRSVEPLYSRPLLPTTRPLVPSGSHLRWLYSCVQQIRQHVWRMECGPGQYAAALAFALLNKAKKDVNATGAAARQRAAAYVFAERVLICAFGPLVNIA